MMEDSLKVIEKEDGTFELEWDKNDPKWSFMNSLTSSEVQSIVEQAIKSYLEENGG